LSPILVRPVREQLEHDRVIRQLQVKYKRKFDVAINPGNTQAMPVGTGTSAWYPDLVLQSGERGKKLLGVVEVETAESVNHLEAMSQWVAFSRLRAPFHLYVPTVSIDNAKRLCTDLQIAVAEVWTYQVIGDQLRFTLVQRSQPSSNGKARVASAPAAPARRAAAPERPASRPARRATPAPSSRRASPAKPKGATARRGPTPPRARKGASSSSRAQKRK
jgi:hypothetical protein